MSFKMDLRYSQLTPKQQAFVDAFEIYRDVTKAALEAYDMKDPVAARAYGLTIMGHVSIAGIIRDYITPKPELKLPTVEELRQMYIEVYSSAEDARTKLAALTAYERVSGYNKPRQKEDQQFDPLLDIRD